MSSKKKLLFIYNPRAGKAKIKSNLLDIIDIFVKADYDVTAYPTQYSGDAVRAVVDRNPGYDVIACSGGDGTFDEVVCGMIESADKLPIGYIPAGSTNDYARSLGIPNGMIKAAKAMVNGKLFKCDIGMLGSDAFVYVAAFGVFTEVTYTTPQDIKNTLGHSAYILEAIKSLPTVKSYHMRVQWEEGVIEDDFLYGMVTNSVSVGGFRGITGHHIFLNDGYYEVTLIRSPQTPIELNNIVIALADRRMDSPNIITFKSSHVTFESDEPVRWTRDGESGGEHTNVDIQILNEAIEVFVP